MLVVIAHPAAAGAVPMPQRTIGTVATTATVTISTTAPSVSGTSSRPLATQAGPTLGPATAFETVDTATVNTTATCRPAGNSRVQFTASGTATGPFPGTFIARGSYTIGPQTLTGGSDSNNLNVGPLQSFKESFAIASPSGTIFGTKKLAPTPATFTSTGGPVNTGACTSFSDATLSQVTHADGTLAEAQPYSAYTAKISTPSGNFADAGASFVIIDQQRVASSSIGPFTAGEFFEDFFDGSSVARHPKDT
jgi:hypothetical protein